MILRELLNYFKLDIELPAYLYDESFNEVFLKGNLVKKNNSFKLPRRIEAVDF